MLARSVVAASEAARKVFMAEVRSKAVCCPENGYAFAPFLE